MPRKAADNLISMHANCPHNVAKVRHTDGWMYGRDSRPVMALTIIIHTPIYLLMTEIANDRFQGNFLKHEAIAFFLNWTIDEAAFRKEVEKDPTKAIFEF